MDFFQLVSEVHPSLDEAKGLQKSISNDTLDLLVKTIQSLEVEKQQRVAKVMTNFLSTLRIGISKAQRFLFLTVVAYSLRSKNSVQLW